MSAHRTVAQAVALWADHWTVCAPYRALHDAERRDALLMLRLVQSRRRPLELARMFERVRRGGERRARSYTPVNDRRQRT